MTLGYTYNGAALTHKVKPTSVSLSSGAEQGDPVMSGLVIEDPDADLVMLGHRPFIVEESACSQPRLFTGWTIERRLGRSFEHGQFGNATAGIHDTTVVDLNALFAFRIISGSDGNRPEETCDARLAWLLGSTYLVGLIEDTGFIIANTRVIDAADYRGRYPKDVLSDLMDRAVGLLNYFAFWDATAAAVGLWVNYVDVATGDSTLRISNDAADIDSSTTFAPDDGASLSRSPEEVFSEVVYEYAHGTKRLFRSRESTATKHVRRGALLSRPWTGKLTTAQNQAEAFLNQHANEQDRITVAIEVPKAKVGLVTVGQRLDVKFTHWPDYTAFTSMRVVRLTVAPVDDLAVSYLLTLELLAPRPVATGDSILIGFLARRADAAFDDTNDPPGWSYLYGGDVRTSGAEYPIILSASSGAGTPTGTEIYGQSTSGSTFTSPGLAVIGAGYIFAGFSYTASGPGDGSSAEFAMDPSGAAVTLSRGYAADLLAPYSWFGYLPVTETGTYSISLIRSAVPRNPAYAYGWQMIFIPGTVGIVQYGSATADGVLLTYTWATPPGGGEADSAVWSDLGSGSKPRGHHVQIVNSASDTEISLPTPPAVTAITDTINNIEYLGDIPLGLPEL